MKKTLMTYLGANIGAAAMVAGLLAATAPEAQSRSGASHDGREAESHREMMISTTVVSSSMPSSADVLPSAENSVPGNSGIMGTQGQKGLGRHDVQQGQ